MVPRWERITIVACIAITLGGLGTAAVAQFNGRANDQAEQSGGGDFGHTYDGCGTACGNQVVFGRATDSGLRGAARSGSVSKNDAGRLSGPV